MKFGYIILLIVILTTFGYQFEQVNDSECSLVTKSDYFARLCKNSSRTRIDIINSDILQNEKDSSKPEILTFDTEHIIDIDFSDHQVMIIRRSLTNINDTNSFDVGVYSFDKCVQMIDSSCISLYSFNHTIQDFQEDDIQISNNINQESKYVHRIKHARIFNKKGIFFIIRSKMQSDQVMVLEYDQTMGTKKHIIKTRVLDFHIGIISSIAVLSKNDENPNILIEVMFVCNDGSSLLLNLTPKTHRVMLPSRQIKSNLSGEIQSSKIVLLRNFICAVIEYK